MLRRIEFDGIETQTIHDYEKGQLENCQTYSHPSVAPILRYEILLDSLHVSVLF